MKTITESPGRYEIGGPTYGDIVSHVSETHKIRVVDYELYWESPAPGAPCECGEKASYVLVKDLTRRCWGCLIEKFGEDKDAVTYTLTPFDLSNMAVPVPGENRSTLAGDSVKVISCDGVKVYFSYGYSYKSSLSLEQFQDHYVLTWSPGLWPHGPTCCGSVPKELLIGRWYLRA